MKPVIKKILYATDLTPNSSHALSHAINLAQSVDAQIVSLYVFDHPSFTIPVHVEDHIPQDKQAAFEEERIAETKERMKKRFQIICEKEHADAPECARRLAFVEVATGYPAELILTKADELDCDIIVMGTHGKGLISQTFLGSMAKKVLSRTRKPVYVIPLPDEETDLTFHDEM